VTDDEFEELMVDCPRLYHMAERGSWPSIAEHGLLSTSSLLDLYNLEGNERERIEAAHRPDSIPIRTIGLEGAVVRDQKPMSDNGLTKCLQDNLTPADWYKILNSKVFFWLTEDRLHRLLGAKTYRDSEHDVLVVNSRSLVEANRTRIWLCPMNSGCTKPFPHPRGISTFRKIPDYPYAEWKKKRKAGERAVELCVEGGVADISEHIVEVRRMSGKNFVEVIY
tara:strand:- start:43 stop:711 length:669 start_codon:yes stop_codon:yes gene_type:complete